MVPEFIITVFLISLTPGPCMTLALNSSLAMGLRKSAFTGLGDLMGLCIYVVLSMIGIGAFLSQYPSALSTAQYIGSAYLIYLGVSAIISKKQAVNDNTTYSVYKSTSDTYFLKLGFIAIITNPKAILFFGIFFPQFINIDNPLINQFLIMLPIVLISETIALSIYAFGGQVLYRALKNQHIVDWVSGGLLILVGIWLGLK